MPSKSQTTSRVKADGLPDMRYSSSKKMLRLDGGLNRSFKSVKTAIKSGALSKAGKRK